MLQNIKQLDEGLKSLVSKELENVSSLDIFLVTRVNYEEYKADIKQLNSSLVYKDVDISSIMLGNGKGLLIPPSVNDLVLVGFLNGHMNSPIIIGSIFNRNMIEPDSILDIREDEVFLGNKINGSYFFIDENNNIKLKLASSGGIYLDDLKMPATSGLSGQVLSSDGAGNAVWVETGSGGYYNFNSPLSVDTLNVYLNLHSNGKLKVSTDAIPDLNTLQLDDTKIDHLDKTLNTGLVTVTNGTGLIGSTPNNTGDWDTAYGWGDHSGLYDTIGTASSEVGTHESTYNHSNYDTAYGWGDHSGLYDTIGTASSEVGTHESTYDHDLISTALQDITGQSIGDLSDVNTTGVDDGKILKWNGVDSFVMADDENTTYDSSDFDHDQLTNTHQSVTTLSSPEFVEVKLSSTSTNNDSAVRYDQLMSVVAGLDWQQSVLAFLNLVTSEPAAPTLGDRYINTATGDSSETTQAVTENYIYEWNGDDWTEIVPNTGFTVWVEGLDTNYTFNATWVEFGSTISHNNTTGLQGGTTSEYYHLTQAEYAGLNISNWDTAYGWGNHADVGYLTSETDPVFSAWLLATPPLYPGGWYDTLQSSVDISGFNNDSGFITGVAWDEITGDQTDISLSGFTDDLSYEVPLTFSTGLTRTDNTITCDITQYTDSDAIDAIQGDASWNATDWDTAYGWGNHADGGYLTSLAGAVLTDQTTPQTIGDTTNRLAKLWASDLVVDNIGIDGSTITGLSNANTVLTAYAGKAIAVEGVSFDGGVVSGITTLSMNNQLTNTLADGTAPFVITSTTKVSNLNADRLDDKHYTEGASFPVSPLDGDLFWNTTDEAFYRYYSAGGDWIQVGGGGMATVSDTAFAASWDTITDVAPSKNTIYDMVNTTVTLGTSDVLVPSQKAVKTYVDTSIENFNNINFQIDGIDGFAPAQDSGLAFIAAFTDTNAGIIGSCIVPQSGTYRLEIRHSNYNGNPTNDIDVRIYACSQNGSEAFSWDLDSATAIQITKPAGQEIIYTRAKDYVLTAGDRVGFYIYKTDNCDGNAGTWSIRGVRLVLQ